MTGFWPVAWRVVSDLAGAELPPDVYPAIACCDRVVRLISGDAPVLIPNYPNRCIPRKVACNSAFQV